MQIGSVALVVGGGIEINATGAGSSSNFQVGAVFLINGAVKVYTAQAGVSHRTRERKKERESCTFFSLLFLFTYLFFFFRGVFSPFSSLLSFPPSSTPYLSSLFPVPPPLPLSTRFLPLFTFPVSVPFSLTTVIASNYLARQRLRWRHRRHGHWWVRCVWQLYPNAPRTPQQHLWAHQRISVDGVLHAHSLFSFTLCILNVCVCMLYFHCAA